MASLHDLLRADSDAETATAAVQDAARALDAGLRLLLARVAEGEPGPWRKRAACAGQVAAMFPERGQPAAPARALCRSCPVLDECRAWVATVPEQVGIVADTSARERMRARAIAA